MNESQREIKFRAWDKKEKRFFYLVLNPCSLSWASPLWTSQHLLLNGENDAEGLIFNNSAGWMQYTGLKDKNGKEIYEGDIVHLMIWHGLDNGYKPEQFTVIYVSNLARFVLKGLDQDEWAFSDMNDIEIIGNIYENPELLGGNH